MHLMHKENEEKNNIDLNSINSNLAFLKNDFSSLTENYMKEIEEIKNNLNKQNNLKNKEITNFEQHVLGEYENFTKFITNILNQNIDKIKSMNEYLNSDVEIIKNKNQYLEETLLKLREDIYDTLKKNSKDILDKMCNESIVYDDDEAYICTPFLDKGLIHDLNEQNSEEIDKIIQTSFYKIYLLLEWKEKAWDIYRKYLIDGILCYEIVYDDLANPKSIINIVELDPVTLTKEVKDMTVYWTQFKGVQGRERQLLDSQVIYIKYEDSGVSTRQSYLERLIRPFNLYRIVEQAQVIWTVTQSSFKTLFTIPVGQMNRAKGIQTLASAMNRYKEDVSFNIDTGELMVNGKPNLPFNKEYWLPQNESGTPQIETLVDNGPQLNDSDQIKYFENKLQKMSKIPITRFDREAGATWFGTDPTQALREEIDFARYIIRLRNTFALIMLKPLRIQLALTFPDIKNDKRILNSVSLRWNSYNLFEEMMNIEVMSKRIEFISTMKESLTETDAEGNDIPYFSIKFLIQKYLKMSEADLDLNEKLKLEEKLKGDNEGSEEEDEDTEESEVNDETEENEEGEGAESESSGEIDDEMMGDVQPESSETTEV